MTDPTNSLYFELDNFPGFYFPGQTVTGRIVRIVTEPEEQIKYLQLKFQGFATAHWETILYIANGNGTNTMIVIPHKNDETYFDDMIQLNQQNDGTWITSLPKGRNEFPFVYHLPVTIPASYKDAEVKSRIKIFYQAVVTFRADKGTEIMAVLNIHVERPVDLNFYPLASQPNLLEGEKYLCCCCCKSGPISFKLMFNKTGFLVGEKIEFLAELVNKTYKNIEIVEVWISRTVTFKGTDKNIRREIWEERMSQIISLPGVPSGQNIFVPVSFDMIPPQTVKDFRLINSFGCSFMSSIHQLHIKMVISCGRNLKGSIPIVIGVVPFVIQPGNTGRPGTTPQPTSAVPSVNELINPVN